MASEVEKQLVEAQAEYAREAAEIIRIQASLATRIADQISRRKVIRELQNQWEREGRNGQVHSE